MKLPFRLRIPALGSLELVGEIELSDDLLRPTPRRDVLTDRELRERWGCSARTLKRLRDERRVPFEQPSPRRFLYRLADVEVYEREHRTERGRLALRRVRGGDPGAA